MLRLDWNLVWTIINLIVLYLILKKFLIGPINKIMAQRQAMIDEQFNSAKTAEQKALDLKAEYEAHLESAHEESVKLIESAKENANVEYERIVKEADTKADKIVKDARKTMEMENEKMLRGVEAQVADLALTAAAKVLGQKADANLNKSMFDEFLANTGELNDSDSK